jgi:hypothetical protein
VFPVRVTVPVLPTIGFETPERTGTPPVFEGKIGLITVTGATITYEVTPVPVVVVVVVGRTIMFVVDGHAPVVAPVVLHDTVLLPLVNVHPLTNTELTDNVIPEILVPAEKTGGLASVSDVVLLTVTVCEGTVTVYTAPFTTVPEVTF